MDPKVLLDLLGPGYGTNYEVRKNLDVYVVFLQPVFCRALLVSWVLQERKETWATQDQWEHQGPEVLVETWEHR